MSPRTVCLVLLGAFGLSACASDARKGRECFGLDDCGSETICFFGQCVDPGSPLTAAFIDVKPAATSPYLAQQASVALGDTARVDLVLRPTVVVEGVLAAPTPGPSSYAGLVRAESVSAEACGAGGIPRHPLIFEARVSSEGVFALAVSSGYYRLAYTPDDSALPPVSLDTGACGLALEHTREWLFPYPSLDELVRVRGALVFSDASTQGPGGAQVVGTALVGNVELRSAAATTVATSGPGLFELVFPPGVTSFDLIVRSGNNPLVPEAVFRGMVPDAQGSLPPLALGVRPGRKVRLVVTDEGGAGLADALLVFTGRVGVGTLHRKVTTDLDGGADVELVAGSYDVLALPTRGGDAGATSVEVEITESAEVLDVAIALPNKATVWGQVHAHDGQVLAGAAVTFTLRNVAVLRQYTTTTDSAGIYTVRLDPLDPATGAPAEYEVVVEPSALSRQPRHRALLRVDAQQLYYGIVHFPASFLYGRVLGADLAYVAGAQLTLYSEELATEDGPLIVGTAESSASGEFAVPLPRP